MTSAGVILGTAAYMSPEQAKGYPADRRSDMWAFGCVLYEMLTGRRTFGGDSLSDTIAAVLRGEPDWRSLPDDTPVRIRVLLKRCLQKDSRQRIHHAADVRIELEDSRRRGDICGRTVASRSHSPGDVDRSQPRFWCGAGECVVVDRHSASGSDGANTSEPHVDGCVGAVRSHERLA